MSTLILPVAGQSSRFPGMRPKWLLTMPSGRLMYEEALTEFDLSKFDRIIVTCLKEHIEKYSSLKALKSESKKNIDEKIEFCVLNKSTNSQPESIYKTIIKMKIKGPIYIKDCDNKFKIKHVNDNSIAVISLNNIDLIDAKNKSYVKIGNNGLIENIVEKSVISSDFCCGGYSFESSDTFVMAYTSLDNSSGLSKKDFYISHLVYFLLLNGHNFKTHQATNYDDWGTLREYRHFCRKKITVFCDIDGVLLLNSSKFSKKPWDINLIKDNVKILSNLQKEGRIYLVITTSRPESESKSVIKQLKKLGLSIDQSVWGLPHSKRILINDFSASNPYPTAIAINIERDKNLLEQHLLHLLS